jgi:GT2 family glycosyltransferase
MAPGTGTAGLVSVVIPTYEREALVLQAVASVLAQGHRPLQVIVVDDGSRDGTARRVAALGPPVELVRLAHTGLPGRVRNAGIRRARGGVVAFLDADDLWLPDKLTRQLALLASRPELGAVYTNQVFEARGRRLPGTRFDRFPPRERLTFPERFVRLSAQVSSLVVRREVLERVGPFHDDLRRYEDAELVGRISERWPLGFIEEPLVVFRLAVDGWHLTADDRLRAREARRYLAIYQARRPEAVRTADEAAAVRRFRGELDALEVWLSGRGGRIAGAATGAWSPSVPGGPGPSEPPAWPSRWRGPGGGAPGGGPPPLGSGPGSGGPGGPDRLPAAEAQGVLERGLGLRGPGEGRHRGPALGVGPQVLEGELEAPHHPGQEKAGEDDLAKPQAIELGRGQPGVAPLEGRDHEVGAPEAPAHLAEAGHVGHPGDEHPVGPGPEITVGPGQGRLQPLGLDGVAASDQLDLGPPAGLHRRPDLPGHLLHRDHPQGPGVAGLLGHPDLVLQDDAAHPEPGVDLHHVDHAPEVAVAVVAVHDRREVGGRDDVLDPGGHLAQGRQADVGQTIAGGQEPRPADGQGPEAGPGDHPGGQGVVGQGRHQGPLLLDQAAEGRLHAGLAGRAAGPAA